LARDRGSIVPKISRFYCPECDFEMPRGWGTYVYVVDDDGRKIVAPHPCEQFVACDVIGCTMKELDENEEYKSRVGVMHYVVCISCAHQFAIDLKRHLRVCPECGSKSVYNCWEMIGRQCPRCRRAQIVEEDTGIIS
jgi:predicted RNA-binding Zn-ribbon protein involved in translation (DUF1610 family)